MYCATCGVALAQDLSYCNYCGAKLTGAKGETALRAPEVRPESLIGGMVVVFVFGIGAITILMGVMKSVLNFSVAQILPFTVLSFLIMLLLEGVFIRLLLHRRGGAADIRSKLALQGQTTKELNAAHAGVLPEAVSSVTERTTRTFEPIYNDRTSK
jgi:hypothetical protein